MTGQPRIHLLYHDDPVGKEWEAIYLNGKLITDCEGSFSAGAVLNTLAEFGIINVTGIEYSVDLQPRKDVTP